TIVVISRLAYRKGVDLLVASAPRICAAFPNVNFVVGGDGPKMIDLLQMREKHFLQDRIEILGPVRHRDVRDRALTAHPSPQVLVQGSIFLNTSLTEAFGIAILEAACAGLYVVSTRVGGVPEILPEDMISFANPTEDDVFDAISEAIAIVSAGKHDPHRAHARIRGFYDWAQIARRTEVVYRNAMAAEGYTLWERMHRTMELGRFAGPIFTIILVVDCLFFMFLEWWMPRGEVDYVESAWDDGRFAKLATIEEGNEGDGTSSERRRTRGGTGTVSVLFTDEMEDILESYEGAGTSERGVEDGEEGSVANAGTGTEAEAGARSEEEGVEDGRLLHAIEHGLTTPFIAFPHPPSPGGTPTRDTFPALNARLFPPTRSPSTLSIATNSSASTSSGSGPRALPDEDDEADEADQVVIMPEVPAETHERARPTTRTVIEEQFMRALVMDGEPGSGRRSLVTISHSSYSLNGSEWVGLPNSNAT
ncbi:hypothetical protein OF83DRAFT_1085218, partial [Amylostereum chailletii]